MSKSFIDVIHVRLPAKSQHQFSDNQYIAGEYAIALATLSYRVVLVEGNCKINFCEVVTTECGPGLFNLQCSTTTTSSSQVEPLGEYL